MVLSEIMKSISFKSSFINIKRNFLFILSAFSFMILNIQISKIGLLSITLSFIMIVIAFSQTSNIFNKFKEIHLSIKIYSFISSLGISYYSRSVFINTISPSSAIKNLSEKIFHNQTIFIGLVSAIIALGSLFVVFILVSLLLNYVFKKTELLFKSLSRVESILFFLLATALMCFVCFVFFKSNAFWGTNYSYDIIYTSDSPSLMNKNVYLNLYHPENDIRQPLFAVFAAPFIGFGYALSVPFASFSPVITPLFVNLIQILMLIISNLMLAEIVASNSIGRICFMSVFSVSYTTLLFSIMMEQYISAYFWLIFLIYTFIKNGSTDTVSISAAGGSLLTSFVLIPLLYNFKTDRRIKIKTFLSSTVKNGFGFLLLLFSFGRLDVLLNLHSKATRFYDFTSFKDIINNIFKYLSFIVSCFTAPDAITDTTKTDHISWQLSENITKSAIIFGIAILLLCLLSFILNRENKLVRISGFWICFSIVLLCFIGWGAAENGMILYSLYFGWAFLVLLFKLSEYISDKRHFKYLTPIISYIVIMVLSFFNFYGIKDLLTFAFTYYPQN